MIRIQSRTEKITAYIFSIALILLLFFLSGVDFDLFYSGTDEPGSEIYSTESTHSIPFRHLNGQFLLIHSPIPAQEIVFTDWQSWKEFWRQHGHGWTPEPDLDFSKNVMAGIFLGEKAPGYRVEIVSVRKKEKQIELYYVEYLPDPQDDYRNLRRVYPWDIVIFPYSNSRIVFIRDLR